MKSDLLSLVLPEDRVRKITCPCPFCTCKYEWTSGFFGLFEMANQVRCLKKKKKKRKYNKLCLSDINVDPKILCFKPFPNKPWFLCICSTSLLKTLLKKKEKLLVMSNFSLSHSVFYLLGELSTFFTKLKIVICNFHTVWKNKKIVVWKWLMTIE